MDRSAMMELAFKVAADAQLQWDRWKAGFGSAHLEAAISFAREADAIMKMATNEGPKGKR